MNTSGLFDTISHHYNRLNHLFSFGLDFLWRRELISSLREVTPPLIIENKPSASVAIPDSDKNESVSQRRVKVLDVACGTGDITIATAKRGYDVIGIDISEGMLSLARHRVERMAQRNTPCLPKLLLCDVVDMPFAERTFDAVTVGYGVRNFDDRKRALGEMIRVLKPGGALIILEFGEPQNRLLKVLYRFYLRTIMPAVVGLISLGKERGAYKYFAQSVENFPKFDKFCSELEEAGFTEVAYKRQNNGISVMYTARR